MGFQKPQEAFPPGNLSGQDWSALWKPQLSFSGMAHRSPWRLLFLTLTLPVAAGKTFALAVGGGNTLDCLRQPSSPSPPAWCGWTPGQQGRTSHSAQGLQGASIPFLWMLRPQSFPAEAGKASCEQRWAGLHGPMSHQLGLFLSSL